MELMTRNNISESIVKRVIELIAKGVYKPGEKLPTERELMQQLGVGRSSIREAFQALAIMGLLSIGPGHGTFVRKITREVKIPPNIFAALIDPEATEELMEARLAVEPTIAAFAAKRHTLDELNDMKIILDQCAAAISEGEPVYHLSAGFHLLIAKASHNTVFLRFMETIAGLMAARGAQIEDHKEFITWELDSHHSLLTCLESRNPDASKLEMEDHIRRSARSYLALK